MTKSPDFYEVRAGSYDADHLVYRFPGTDKGRLRAYAYTNAYNAAYLRSLGLTEADAELREHRYMGPDELERARSAKLYRSEQAGVVPVDAVSVVRDDEPVPTDYPF